MSSKEIELPKRKAKPADQYAGVRARLKVLRGSRSQRAFAKQIGVFQQNLSRYEQPHGPAPHVAFLVAVAESERINLNWLILGKGAMRARSRA